MVKSELQSPEQRHSNAKVLCMLEQLAIAVRSIFIGVAGLRAYLFSTHSLRMQSLVYSEKSASGDIMQFVIP